MKDDPSDIELVTAAIGRRFHSHVNPAHDDGEFPSPKI
jgi:hypothetical protein